ncbi:MAG: ABC transporter ATP-binding protein [Proteobacteria bacterium]|nr:ABC transporter ATP-binding protein [Pseudomonadota bacterium]
MGEDSIIIRLEDVCFSYPGGARVLERLNFELKTGEKAGLIGDNGSGKTTLLHIIIGILKAEAGTIRLFGESVRSEKDFYRVRQQVGFLFQNSDDQLFCPTVLEDIAFGPLNLGKSTEEARQIALKTLADLNLQGFENRITHQLSGGEKKLVALATILAMQPKVLLLDEPTSGLDESTKKRLADILGGLKISYIMVSHEYDFLIRNTGSIYGIKNGLVNYHGKSSTLHSHYHSHSAGALPHRHA